MLENFLLPAKVSLAYSLIKDTFLCLATHIMRDYGQGYCENGYYKGWDGLGDGSAEECKMLCLKEPTCQFAAYYRESNGQERTCSRYNEPSCKLLVSTNKQRGHTTFRKTKRIRERKSSSEGKRFFI